MTPTLVEVRAELVADLEAAGLHPTEHLDKGLEPPAVVIACGNPYLTDAEVLRRDELQMRLELFVVFEAAEGEAMTSAVDRAVQDVLLAIDDRWTFLEASAPFRATNLHGLPVCRLRLSTNTRMTTAEGTPTP